MNTVPSAAHFKHSNHVITCSNHMFKMYDDRCYVNGNGSSGLEIISKSNIEFISCFCGGFFCPNTHINSSIRGGAVMN